MANEIEIVLTARDNASGAINNFRRSTDAANESANKFGGTLRNAIQPVQAMTDAVISKLNPALAGAVSGLSMASREVRNLPVALGTLTVGVAAVAAGLGIFIERFDKATQATAKIGQAARGGDLAALRSISLEAADAMGLYAERTRAANQEITGAQSALEIVISFWQKTINEGPEAYAKRIAQANEQIVTLLPLERVKAFNQGLIEQAQAQAQITQLAAQRALLENNSDEFLGSMLKLTAALFNQADATERIIAAETQLAVMAAERRNATALEIVQIRELGALRIEAARAQEGAQYVAIQHAARTGGRTLAERRGQQNIGFAGVEDLTVNPDFAGVNRELDRQRREDRAAADVARLQMLTQQAHLTEAQRHEYELMLIEAEKLLKIEAARGNLQQRGLADLEAQVRQQNEIRAYAEHTEALPGLQRGFRDMADEFGAAGLRMQSMARGIAEGMSNAFGDGFFDVITGNFKDLPDVAKRFTQDMIRSVTQELGKLATAPILASLRGLLGGGASGGSPFR